MTKSAVALKEKDFRVYPVWKFANDDENGETRIFPLKKIPVANLDGKLVGCPVTFANGSEYFAMFGNVDTKHAKLNEHFLSISIWYKGKWIYLARYFDVDFQENGPKHFAKGFGLKRNEIFPISYDFRRYTKGLKAALVGKLFEKPKKKLSQKMLIDTIVSNL